MSRTRRYGGLLLLLCLVQVPTFAADASSARERTRQTLLYGIDSQVLEAIQAITAANDTSFTPELTRALNENASADVQAAVFGLFRQQKIRDGEERGKAVLGAWQDTRDAVLIPAIQYLAAIHSTSLAAGLPPLVDAPSNPVSLAAIQALGTSGDAGAVTFLVTKLTSTDFPDARKNDIVLALGTLKNAAAVDALVAIAANTDEDKVRRMYAADSLGKIGDKRALPTLKSMVAENDALVRLYAASALSQFGLDEVFPTLIQGLRDENAKVRQQSAKALARQLGGSQAETAVPILSYKAEFDPEPTVRAAAIEALGAIGGDGALKVLLKIYSGADHRADSREAALSVLAVKYLAESTEAIRSVVAAEWTSYDQRTVEATARVLSGTKSSALREIFARFLDSPNPVVRSYGARGIGANGFSDLKDRLRQMAERDANGGTRREAALAAEKL